MSTDFIKISKNDKLNYAVTYAILLIFVMIIYEFLVIKTCTKDITCLVFAYLPIFLGTTLMSALGVDLSINFLGAPLYVPLSMFLWGLIGALVGFIMASLKKKQVVTNNQP